MVQLLKSGEGGSGGGDQATAESQVIPVDHSLTFAWMRGTSSAVVLTKPPIYLVPVVTWRLMWSKSVLARSSIAGFTTKIDLAGSGKYPRVGLLDCNKLKTLSISSNFPQLQYHLHTMALGTLALSPLIVG